SIESLEYINHALAQYNKEWYPYLDVFVHLSAPNLSTIFNWREEQELDLWKLKGSGMSKEDVRLFVERFMPAYELYLERLKTESFFKGLDDLHSKKGRSGSNEPESIKLTTDYEDRHLRIDLNVDREVIQSAVVN